VVNTLPVGSFPYAIAHDAARNRIFVTNQHDNTVSVLDTGTGGLLATLEVGDYPEGITMHPDGRHVHVACWFDGEVAVVDAETLEVVRRIKAGEGSRAFGDFIAPR